MDAALGPRAPQQTHGHVHPTGQVQLGQSMMGCTFWDMKTVVIILYESRHIWTNYLVTWNWYTPYG